MISGGLVAEVSGRFRGSLQKSLCWGPTFLGRTVTALGVAKKPHPFVGSSDTGCPALPSPAALSPTSHSGGEMQPLPFKARLHPPSTQKKLILKWGQWLLSLSVAKIAPQVPSHHPGNDSTVGFTRTQNGLLQCLTHPMCSHLLRRSSFSFLGSAQPTSRHSSC